MPLSGLNPRIAPTVDGADQETLTRLVLDLDEPLSDGVDLARALVMALAGGVTADFGDDGNRAALTTLANAVARNVGDAFDIWESYTSSQKVVDDDSVVSDDNIGGDFFLENGNNG